MKYSFINISITEEREERKVRRREREERGKGEKSNNSKRKASTEEEGRCSQSVDAANVR